jgi:AraC-like DNA-binding protein
MRAATTHRSSYLGIDRWAKPAPPGGGGLGLGPPRTRVQPGGVRHPMGGEVVAEVPGIAPSQHGVRSPGEDLGMRPGLEGSSRSGSIWPGSTMPQSPVEIPQQHLEIVRSVLQFIECRFRDGMTLASIARNVGVSRSHLCRVFRRITGQSLKGVLTRRRLQAAKTMLRDQRVMIHQVAVEVGYRDMSHFDRVFRRLEGQTPSSYKRRYASQSHPSKGYQNEALSPHRSFLPLA